MSTPAARQEESSALPPAHDAVVLLVALARVSASGPIMAATAAPALAVGCWRNALGAGVTGLSLLRGRRALTRIDRRTWAVSGLAGVMLALHFGTWVPSLTLTSVASATALVSTQSVFIGMLAVLTGRRLPVRAWVGMSVAIVGTALIAGADLAVSLRSLGSDGLALTGAVSMAGYVTVGPRARRSISTPAYPTICYSVCSVLLLLACLLGPARPSGDQRTADIDWPVPPERRCWCPRH